MVAKQDFFRIYVLILLAMVRGNSDSKPESDSTTTERPSDGWKTHPSPTEAVGNMACSDVQQIFVMKQIGSAEMVPETPISGEDLQTCRAQSTCCTKQMEEKYREAVQKDFLNIMHTTSSYVKNLIANNAAKLQESFIEMVRTSSNNTHALFSDVYKRMASEAGNAIDRLFGDISSYLRGKEVDVEESVGIFFDTLFPLVYRHSINPKLKEFSEDYTECLQETQQEIQPFGDLPRRIALHVAKSTAAARALVQALALGVEVMNATENAVVSAECTEALLRLTYCPHCRGLVNMKPCNGYCINVVRGCLANMAELDQPWNDYVSALERLTFGMKGVFNVEDVLELLDSKISEAIMYAMENGPELSKTVKRACGHPRRATRQVNLAGEQTDSKTEAEVSPPASSSSVATPKLHVRLFNFVKNLAPSKGFYSSLAETLCNDDNMAVRRENNCWNGRTIGEYGKTIVGMGVSAQKYNPEMNSSRTVEEKINHLIDKLKHMRQMLMTKITPIPESDSMMNDGSGSGYNSFTGDDEDYEATEGSGSGYYSEPRSRGKSKGKNAYHPNKDNPNSIDSSIGEETITLEEDNEDNLGNEVDVSHHQGGGNRRSGSGNDGKTVRGSNSAAIPIAKWWLHVLPLLVVIVTLTSSSSSFSFIFPRGVSSG